LWHVGADGFLDNTLLELKGMGVSGNRRAIDEKGRVFYNFFSEFGT
jgi:hypothetical protein